MSRCRPSSGLALALVAACGGGDDGEPDPGAMPYETLGAYGLFEGPLAAQRPREGVVAYEVASELWADGMGKDRYIVVPEGQRATFDAGEDWAFPIGTIVVKVFWSALDRRAPDGPRRLLETRLLIRGDEGWTGHTYVWNDEQTEAVRTVPGARLEVETIDESGARLTLDYLVPNTNQCASCHARDDVLHLLGVVGPQLARSVEVDGAPRDQLPWLAEQGLFDPELADQASIEPLASPTADGPVEGRARAWLHANCAHCHRPGGGGGRSGLVLLAWEDDPQRLGVCKVPAAAGPGTGGHSYDIVPGDPDASILPFRIASTDPAIKMPELPNRLPDPLGLALVRDWIAAMPARDCAAPD
jgi:uncharacterized repeat protein (TIGR03806 family)